MKIISPSYKRAKTVRTHKLLDKVIYAVHEFEKEEYKKEGFEIIVLPDGIRGNIPNVRNWLLDQKFQKELLFIDDDIDGFNYWQNCKQIKLSGQRLLDHIENMLELAKSWGVSLFGVNPASDKGSYREYTPFSTTSYISCSFHGLINCKHRYDSNLPLKEDYDLCIQICNDERQILRFNQYSLSKKDHKNRGGCADYRTVEREKLQMKAFQKKWGGQIVQEDKLSKGIDINPIVKIPIRGV
jgi:hypothetical protein